MQTTSVLDRFVPVADGLADDANRIRQFKWLKLNDKLKKCLMIEEENLEFSTTENAFTIEESVLKRFLVGLKASYDCW